MTEATGRRRRWPKGRIRLVAWLAGGVAFLVSGSALGIAPKPATDDARGRRHKPAPRQTIIKHHVVRTIVYDPPAPTSGGTSITYVSGGSGSSGSSGTTTTSTTSTSGGSSGGSTGGSSSGSSTGSGGTTTTGGS